MFAMSLQRSSISYLYCIFQTQITMQTSLFRARCEGWGLVERQSHCSKGWLFDDMSSQPFLEENKLTVQQTPTSSADWSAHAFATAKQIFLHWHVVPFFSYKHQTWIIRLLMSPEVVSKASKAAKAMLGMSWLADKSQGGRGRASKRRDI